MTKPRLKSIIRQPPGSKWCAPACAATLLRYHGVRLSMAACAAEARTSKTGTSAPNSALLFLRRGFDVKMLFWSERFKGTLLDVKDDELYAKCKSTFRAWHWVRAMKEFRELGGTFEARPTRMEELEAAADRNEPAIVTVDPALLDRLDTWMLYHAVIPVKFTSKHVTVLDPAPGVLGGRLVYDREMFEQAFRWTGSKATFISRKR